MLLDKRVGEVNARIDRFELEVKAQLATILPAVDLRLAKDGRRNLVWFIATLTALFRSRIYSLR